MPYAFPAEDAAAAIQRLLQERNTGLSDAVNGSVRGRARHPGSARDIPAADANRGARTDISRRAGTPRRPQGQVVLVDAGLPCGADEASPFREAASTWLSGQPNGPRRVGFPWQPLVGVVRISTYEKTLGHPLTPKQPVGLATGRPGPEASGIPRGGPGQAHILTCLTTRYPRNLVSDARFCGVRWINPAASP
jgi:hypothetical protein